MFWHNGLLYTPKSYGISGQVFEFFLSFLSNSPPLKVWSSIWFVEEEFASQLESDLQGIAHWDRKWLVDFNSEKHNLCCLTCLITLVLLMWKWMGLFWKNSWDYLFLLNWIEALTLSLLLLLSPRKLEPWFIPWSFFLLRLPFISINLPAALHRILVDLT